MDLLQLLQQMKEGDLAILHYKLTNNRIPPPDARKEWFVDRVHRLMKRAGDRLNGVTLPADYGAIDNLQD